MTKGTPSVTVKIPDVVGHRGFSGKFPENTLISFENAIKADTTALEGDIRLSKDGEIVMMHDISLDRTTTGTGKVPEVNWHGYIDGLRTKSEPPQPIPLFKDVVQLMLRPDVVERNIYMVVDIKFDNSIDIMKAVHDLLHTEFAEHLDTLSRQLVIGIWHTDFLESAKKLFPGFTLCFIGLSLEAARKYFVDTVDVVSMPFAALADKDGREFIADIHKRGKRVATWTINDVEQMHVCVALGVDMVIGDHVDVMVKHVREAVADLSDDEFRRYVESSTYLAGLRRRIYFYLVKKGLHYASRVFIAL
ncbi:PLC-like phosphodiesterase [Dichotomocladium elegans]|nr:PLC-like phosphodiesterase [Dichotomocladium elegans]